MCTATANQQLRRRGQLYLLGHSRVEQSRLRRQAEELRQESNSLFDRVGLCSSGRAIDIGCGPQGVLDFLSERVGCRGLVVGIERDDKSVATARQFAAAER
jgi:trans-aconitate methyltransferase